MSQGDGAASREFFQDLVANEFAFRRETFSRLFNTRLDPRRDYDREFGHPKPSELTAAYYQLLHDYDPIGCRVDQVLPRECWQVQPEVYEDEDADVTTPFEARYKEVCRSLAGGRSWHKDDYGSRLAEALRRADEQSGIGHYGGLLLGLDDTPTLDSYRLPAERRQGRELLYVRSFPESLLTILKWDQDVKSPRYMQPLSYGVTLASPVSGERTQFPAQQDSGTFTLEVHWSRVVHLADNLESSEWIASSTPRRSTAQARKPSGKTA
jgi:hypothetical protein